MATTKTTKSTQPAAKATAPKPAAKAAKVQAPQPTAVENTCKHCGQASGLRKQCKQCETSRFLERHGYKSIAEYREAIHPELKTARLERESAKAANKAAKPAKAAKADGKVDGKVDGKAPAKATTKATSKKLVKGQDQSDGTTAKPRTRRLASVAS